MRQKEEQAGRQLLPHVPRRKNSTLETVQGEQREMNWLKEALWSGFVIAALLLLFVICLEWSGINVSR